MASYVAPASCNEAFGAVTQIENNVLKLKLKKPKSWNWELSTSKSSSHIDIPRVLLYDNYDKLLADIGEADLIVNGKENIPKPSAFMKFTNTSKKNEVRKSHSFCSLSSSNGQVSLTFNKCKHPEDLPPCYKQRDYNLNNKKDINVGYSTKIAETLTDLNEKNLEVPIFIYSAKGLVQRDFNAKEFDKIRKKQLSQENTNNDYSISDTNYVERKRTLNRKKVHQVRSASSLHSIKSQNKNDKQNLSSEDDELEQPSNINIYHLKKSTAGVLVVPEPINSNSKIRRRHSSKNTELLDKASSDDAKIIKRKNEIESSLTEIKCGNDSKESLCKSATMSSSLAYNSGDNTYNKHQLRRKVSFAKLECKKLDKNHHHDDSCNLQQERSSKKDRSIKQIRKNLKKSVSRFGFKEISSSDTLSSDIPRVGEKPPARTEKRRQQLCSKYISYLDDQTISLLQKSSNNLEASKELEQHFLESQNLLINGARDIKDDETYTFHNPKCHQTYSSDTCESSIVARKRNSDNDVNNNINIPNVVNKSNVKNVQYHYQKVYHDGTEKTGNFTNTFLNKNFKKKDRCIELKAKLRYKQHKYQYDCNMGSNISRDFTKSLSERRSQSSGDLIGEHLNETNGYNQKAEIGSSIVLKNNDQTGKMTLKAKHPVLTNLNRTERNKCFGSLPNHLDETYPKNKSNVQKNLLGENDCRYYPSSSSHVSHLKNVKLFNSNEATKNIKLAVNRSSLDIGCDQGYGSERSPEDDFPPILSVLHNSFRTHLQTNQDLKKDADKINENDFPFIKEDCSFTVQVMKNERGLGISLYGGIDTNVPFRGLIRIKRIFPNQSAWSTGMLQQGDILLEGNEVKLTGLTNHQALEVLRTAPNSVTLKVCRPHDETFCKLSIPLDPPKPPQRSHLTSIRSSSQSSMETNFNGDFEIVMTKQHGSLGFTLRKENESAFGHYVRTLVRDPAASDGRIKPGDKIVAVNDVPLTNMTHEEAVIFLRQTKDQVKLRLFRDSSQTPIGSMSPISGQLISMDEKPKANLRPEAMNLLIDLAHKNRKQSCESYSTESSVQSRNTSPRRLIRNNNKNLFSNNDSNPHFGNSKTSLNFNNCESLTYTENMEQLACSDSETSTISQTSLIEQSMAQYQPFDGESSHTTNLLQPQENSKVQSKYYNEEELWHLMEGIEYSEKASQPDRPCHLDIVGSSEYTPLMSRKAILHFSAANGYELNNLNNEALDAPVYNSKSNQLNLNSEMHQHGNYNDYASLPCEAMSMSQTFNSENYGEEFSYSNPAYQSANIKSKPNSDPESTCYINKPDDGMNNLLKWKGIMFGIDDADKTTTLASVQTPVNSEATTTTSSEIDSSCATMIEINPLILDNGKSVVESKEQLIQDMRHQIINIELSRGWNSRLGFSLRCVPNSKQTIVSAIYNDSVAAKDGRLRVGDKLIMVNDESVESKSTADIIDLLRIIRGSIVLVVERPCV